jgi:hypothetical protein
MHIRKNVTINRQESATFPQRLNQIVHPILALAAAAQKKKKAKGTTHHKIKLI